MRKLLTLYTKNVHFSFKNKIYIQIEGVTRSSPLGPMIANIFMAELENTLVPKLDDDVKKWKRFIDDTFVYVQNGSIEYALSVLTF